MSDVKLRLRWFPGRYGISHAELAGFHLSVGYAMVQPKDGGADLWECRSVLATESFRGTRQAAQAHIEGLVRDRLIKALAAFGEEK